MANSPQRSFVVGELSPALWARTDVARYAVGLRTCRNFIIQRTGGANYRPGTDFVAKVKDSSLTVRLLRFIFSITDAFVLEFGDHYIRFYQDGAVVSAGGGVPYEIPTPYAQADVGAIRSVQSGDIITLVHPNYPPYELRRNGNTNWSLNPIVFGPGIPPPTLVVVVPGILGPGRQNKYYITAIDQTTGEESLGGATANVTDSYHTPSDTQPDLVTWAATPNAVTYNIYLAIDRSNAGLIGTATTNAFSNPGLTPDFTINPPVAFTGFAAAGDYPSTTGYYQQRQLYGSTTHNPEKVWCSQTGNYKNFSLVTPLQDDGPVTFTLANAEVCQVQHLLDLGQLILGTNGGEWTVRGDTSGILTPFAINPRIGSYNGSSPIPPVKVGDSVLYVQALTNKILELRSNFQYGTLTFSGRDMTINAGHLFDGYQIVDMDSAQIPNYLVWVVRSDGILLGCTYLDDEQVLAWHHHDTLGTFENVCVIPEHGEHRTYVVVNRTINGVTKRYVERMRRLSLLNIVNDASFMDAALEYDGRNASNITMTISGTTSDIRVAEDGDTRVTEDGDTRNTEGIAGWSFDDLLTLLASSSYFTAAMVGRSVRLVGTDGTVLFFAITAVLGATTVQGFASIDVPVAFQNVAISAWGLAVATVSGLDHLEGQAVSVFADGFVVANPNDPRATVLTVTNGSITLPQAYEHIRVGLPYIGDVETLDIDTPQGQSLKETKIAITAVGLWVQASRPGWVGRAAPTGTDATAALREFKLRRITDNQSVAPVATTEYIKTDINAEWNSGGRILVRQIDPLPLNVLAAIPLGFIPDAN